MLSLALGPILLPQGLWTRWRTPRLPEPPGPRSGVHGEGPRLALLIAGDSAAAGVGATHQDEALLGQLVGRLGAAHRVHYRLEAETGATTESTIRRLEALQPSAFDVAVLSLGVNDVTRGLGLRRWLPLQALLWALLRSRFGVGRMVVCGLPPMHGFPALPQPLRWYLGTRASEFDAALAANTAAESGMTFLSLRFSEDVGLMAADGFHPGPPMYAEWAERAAALLLDQPAASG